VVDVRRHDDGFTNFVRRGFADPARDVSRQHFETRGGDPVVVGYEDSHTAYDNWRSGRVRILQ
jgi:hypothetical protein